MNATLLARYPAAVKLTLTGGPKELLGSRKLGHYKHQLKPTTS